MKELVVVSGKGGTGKTSIVASFAALSENKVILDCDVDAADLHLVLDPTIRSRRSFSGSKTARIMADKCTLCGKCREVCRFDAVERSTGLHRSGPDGYRIEPVSCEGCGVCARLCPMAAIELEASTDGEWFVSDTRYGPMVHAKLGVAGENSGKLVTIIRTHGRQIAKGMGLPLIIADGAPGIGCPVTASITGASLVLVVIEPTLSGVHDLERMRQLTHRLQVPTIVCINKYDINEDISNRIASYAKAGGMPMVGTVRYDAAVTRAQITGASVVEYTDGAVAREIQAVWRNVARALR